MKIKPQGKAGSNRGNAWPFTRWITAAVIYGLTLTAGMAQDAATAGRREMAQVQAELRAVQRQCTEADARVRLLEAEVAQIKTLYAKALESGEASQKSRRGTPVGAESASPMLEAKAPLAAWEPPQMSEQTELIKDGAADKWRDNYAMREYEIGKQTAALTKLRELNRLAENGPLLAAAAEKWPDNYAMMLYEIGKQVAAKSKIEAMR